MRKLRRSKQVFVGFFRFRSDEGTFDPREYRANNPIGFETLALKWLEIRRSEVGREGISPNTYRALEDAFIVALPHSSRSRSISSSWWTFRCSLQG